MFTKTCIGGWPPVWSLASASNTFYFWHLLSTTVLTLSFSPLLDYETEGGGNTGEPEDNYEIVYEEPDLSGGVEGVDYRIVYGVGDEEQEEE